jgi:hypothetical protein
MLPKPSLPFYEIYTPLQVCSGWRAASMGCPELWTTIYLDYEQFYGFAEINVTDFVWMLDRFTKGRPFDIIIDLRERYHMHSPLKPVFWSVMGALAGQVERWRSLEIKQPHRAVLQHVCQVLEMARILESFRIYCPEEISESLGPIDVRDCSENMWLNSLTELIAEFPESSSIPDLTIPNLMTLKLKHWPPPSTISFLWRDNGRNLTELELVGVRITTSIPQDLENYLPTSFSSLRRFKFIGEALLYDTLLPIEIIARSPKLVDLTAATFNWHQQFQDLCDAALTNCRELTSFTHIIDEKDAMDLGILNGEYPPLYYGPTWDEDREIGGLLRSFPSIERLSIHWVCRGDTLKPCIHKIILALIKKSDTSDSFKFCPRLRKIELRKIPLRGSNLIKLAKLRTQALSQNERDTSPFRVSIRRCFGLPNVESATHQQLVDLFEEDENTQRYGTEAIKDWREPDGDALYGPAELKEDREESYPEAEWDEVDEEEE